MDTHAPDETREPSPHQGPEPVAPAPTSSSARAQDNAVQLGTAENSFAAYLSVVSSDVSPVLIADDEMRAIADVARLLPGPLALQTFGFECNLSRPEPTGDFLLLVQNRAGRAELAGGVPESLRDHPVWSRLRAFLDAWGDTTLALSSTVDHVWLEFDVSTSAGGTPVPSVFHGYRSMDGVDAVTTATPSRSQLEATCRAFHILSGRPVALAVVEQLGACFEHLPAGARVFQLGAMIARDTDAFRVCVNFLDVSQILPYLDQLGWTGERARLQRLLRQLEGRVDRLALDLDMSTSVLPKVGLECYLIRDDGAQAQRWSPFLDSLVEGGIALEPKCRALLDYPGLADFRRDGNRWPDALRRTSELLGSAAISVFWRGIHHVKLVLEPGQPAEAKAYLSVNHRWITPDLISGRR